MKLYNNNDTIVTRSQFIENPINLLKGTIARKALLIIQDDDTLEDILVIDPIKMLKEIEDREE